jgi:outer membrane lipoprotein-sorting protein
MNWFDRDHGAERARLLAALGSLANEVQPARAAGWRQPLKEVLRMPRTWIGAAAAAALALAAFFLWSEAGSAPALADTAQALRDVKAYRCRVTTTMKNPDGKEEREVSKWYWAQPGSIRWEDFQDGKLALVSIHPKDKPGLEINYRSETYQREEPVKGTMSPIMILTRLAKYAGQADRQLEHRKIEGIDAPGFEIALVKIDPDIGPGTLRLWTNPKTSLPLRAEMAMDVLAGGEMVFDQFEWNVKPENWFNVEPPAGFQDKTPTPVDVDEITRHIIVGLKTYAKYCGGRYPQAKMVYGDVTSIELNRTLGLPDRSPPKDRALDKAYSEAMKASLGFGWINTLQREDAGAIYHGKTVGPQDKNKVLFRWTRPDGRFRVLYGDLHFEDVTAARLKKLESQ